MVRRVGQVGEDRAGIDRGIGRWGTVGKGEVLRAGQGGLEVSRPIDGDDLAGQPEQRQVERRPSIAASDIQIRRGRASGELDRRAARAQKVHGHLAVDGRVDPHARLLGRRAHGRGEDLIRVGEGRRGLALAGDHGQRRGKGDGEHPATKHGVKPPRRRDGCQTPRPAGPRRPVRSRVGRRPGTVAREGWSTAPMWGEVAVARRSRAGSRCHRPNLRRGCTAHRRWP